MAVKIDSQYPIAGCIESLVGGRKENQDSSGFADLPYGCVIIVCDGMGGGNGGGTASSLAVNTIIDDLKNGSGPDYKSLIENAIKHANQIVYETGKAYRNLQGMGTTCAILLLTSNSAIIAHVGDSRIYQLRNRRKEFRTNDHSMVFQMVANSLISEEEARVHPQSNVILKALGIGPEVEPEIHEVPYNSHDRFLLCSDGVWGVLPEKELLKKVCSKEDLGRVIYSLTREIDGIGFKNGGGHDNLTAALVEVSINSKMNPKMRKSQIVTLLILLTVLLLSVLGNIFSARYLSHAPNKPTIKEFFLSSPNSDCTNDCDTCENNLNNKEEE